MPKLSYLEEKKGGWTWSPDALRRWLNGQTFDPTKIRAGMLNGDVDLTDAHDTHDHTTALGTAAVADLSDVDAWATWSPTQANHDDGNGTTTARYAKIGTTIFCFYEFVFGASGASMGTNPTITLPVTAASSYDAVDNWVGSITIVDSGTARFYGNVHLNSTTVAGFFAIGTAATHAGPASITSTVPMTWASGDKLVAQFWYEAA